MKKDQPANWNATARIAKNSAVQLAAGIVNKLLGVVLVIYAARQLGAAGFGQYSFILSMQTIFYILADFGLGTLATRDLARSSREEPVYFGNIFLMRVALSLVAGGSMILSVKLLGHSTEIVLLTAIASLSIFFTSNCDTITSLFNAHERMEIPAGVSVLATTIRVTASLGVLVGGAGIWLLLWVHSLSALVQLLILLWILKDFLKPVFRFDPAFWKKMLLAAYPLALATIFSVIYFRVDTILLASLKGQEAVGLYNAAYRLLELTLILPSYYMGAIFPVISTSYKQNQQRFLLIYRRSLKYMWLISLPLAAGTAALAGPFIHVLYGEAYVQSIPVLRILMWTLVLIALNSINAPYLIIMGRQHQVTYLTVISMLLNLGLNLWLIPRYGMMGAAWVTLGCEVLNWGLFAWILRKALSLDFGIVKHLIRPGLAAACMYAVLVLFLNTWGLLFQIIIGALIYGVGLWILKAFDEVDMELFQRILRPREPGRIKIT